jgi:hypothetical protein
MNPILAEDIMRKRAHRSVIVLATLLAWLLVTPDSASAADKVMVVIPVNLANFHEDVRGVRMRVQFYNDQGVEVGTGQSFVTPNDVEGLWKSNDWPVYVGPIGGQTNSIFDATTYKISLGLSNVTPTVEWVAPGAFASPNDYCEPNVVVDPATDPDFAFCNGPFAKLQTYENPEGPISDLIPE